MLRLNSRDPGFGLAFERLVNDRRESDDDVARDVALILADVRNRGDAALAEYTQRWDEHSLASEADWRIDLADCREAFDALQPDLRAALELAATRIRAFHESQLPKNRDSRDEAWCAARRALAAGRCGGALYSRRAGVRIPPRC